MKRLGYLSFNSNEGTGHQARELKSVRLNTEAYLLRLVIQRCHTNKLNIYNQVSLTVQQQGRTPQQGPAAWQPLAATDALHACSGMSPKGL